MEYISKNEMAQLKGQTLTVKAIFGPKRTAFNKAESKSEEFVLQGEDWKKVEWVDKKRTLVDCKIDYKNTKKVYDLSLTLTSAVNLTTKKWNRDTRKEEDVELNGMEFTVKNVTAPIIRDLLEATIAFGKVPTDKEGNPQYDWEELFIKDAPGVTFQLTPRKAEFNGKSYFEYTFRETKAEASTSSDDDLPFN